MYHTQAAQHMVSNPEDVFDLVVLGGGSGGGDGGGGKGGPQSSAARAFDCMGVATSVEASAAAILLRSSVLRIASSFARCVSASRFSSSRTSSSGTASKDVGSPAAFAEFIVRTAGSKGACSVVSSSSAYSVTACRLSTLSAGCIWAFERNAKLWASF